MDVMLTDVPRSSLMAYIIFWLWLKQTSGMVSCAARAEIARTRRITPFQGFFTPIFLLIVSCQLHLLDKSRRKRGYNGGQ
jgi:hypothetical protein